MKKALKNSYPTKLVRRVLSRTSNAERNSEKSDGTSNNSMENRTVSNLDAEMSALRDQVSMLQLAVNAMQEDADKKEKAVANLSREKEQLACDLRKLHKANANLKQQLDDEREFYYNEKEKYCHEMNSYKNIKKQMLEKRSSVSNENSSEEIQAYKKQISQLKEALNQTLEANYNVSIKFLRMQNTKTFLKARLQSLEEEHFKVAEKLKKDIEELRGALNFVIEKHFESTISPSNKKFLQIVRDNGKLVHDNLCLQMEIENLTQQLDKAKQHVIKTESRNKLKYINSNPNTNEIKTSTCKCKKKVTINPHVEKRTNSGHTEKERMAHGEPISKIYERAETQAIPTIAVVEAQTGPELYGYNSQANLALAQVSGFPSQMSTYECETDMSTCVSARTPVRTQSAPEVIESSTFLNNGQSSEFLRQ